MSDCLFCQDGFIPIEDVTCDFPYPGNFVAHLGFVRCAFCDLPVTEAG